MEIRELKYYKWVFNKDKVILVNKKEDKSFVLSLAMADSFSRACISFRNRYRIEQMIKIYKILKKTRISYQKSIDTLKLQINKLKERKNVKKTNQNN